MPPEDMPSSGISFMFPFSMNLSAIEGPELIRTTFTELLSTLPHVRLTARDVTRWKMAWRACQPHTQKIYGNVTTLSDAWHQQLLVRRCTDEPDWDDIFKIPTILGFTAATFIYGGLHALAWSAHFDSTTEKLLWRISSCIVMGGPPMILSSPGWRWTNIFGIVWLALLSIDILMLVVYTLARAYLVVECFINVFHLPAGVFDTPEWSTYFPHIS